MRLLVAYLIGILFGVGIVISGMANPAKVLNFFDLAGTWDPSLAFVMGGGVLVTFVGYRLVTIRKAPILSEAFSFPTRSDLDAKLIAGSLVFGLGWGIAGFCPGGALPVIGTGNVSVIVFVLSVIVGIMLTKSVQRKLSSNYS